MVARTFNPAQHPRDRFGRFTKSRTVRATPIDRKAAQQVAAGFAPQQVARDDREAYLRKVSGRDDASASFEQLVATNKALRAGKDAPGAADVERAMVELPDDLLLSRRVPLTAFGAAEPESLTGMKVRDAGFAPAQLGTVAAVEGHVRMHLAVPAGTRAAVNPATGEVVLDRDTEMVVARVDSNSAGGHDMWLTVLPKTGKPEGGGNAGPEKADTAEKPTRGDTADDGSDLRADLMKLRVPELQAQMRERGLKPGRLRKSQLVDALVADETGKDTRPGKADTAEVPAADKPSPEPPEAPRPEPAVGKAALASAPLGLHRPGNGLTPAEQDGLTEYQDGSKPGFRGINAALRAGEPGKAQASIDGIDAAMAHSPLDGDVVVYRGVRNARSMFGDRLDGDLAGMRWREDAFVSTTSDERAAAAFSAGKDGVRMRIVAPAGTGAVDLSDPGDASEEELLLDRGHELEVVADRGTVDGVRQLDVRVLPKDVSPAPAEAAPAETPDPGADFTQRLAAAAAGKDALKAAPSGLLRRGAKDPNLTPARREALNAYRGALYTRINGALRTGNQSPESLKRIKNIDAAMAGSKLTSDVLVYRGVTSPRGMFGDRIDSDLTGMEWDEAAYVSTSASEKLATFFATGGAGRDGGMLLRIVASAGTGGVELSGTSGESEILIERGRSFRVVADRGKSAEGVRMVDVEIVPAGAGS